MGAPGAQGVGGAQDQPSQDRPLPRPSLSQTWPSKSPSSSRGRDPLASLSFLCLDPPSLVSHVRKCPPPTTTHSKVGAIGGSSVTASESRLPSHLRVPDDPFPRREMRKGCFSQRFPSRGRTVCLTLLCDYVILLLCCPPTSSSLFLFLPEEGRSWNRTRRFPACPVHVPAPRTTSGLSRDNSPFSPTDGERGAAPGNPAPSLHHQRLALQTDPPWA